MATTIFFQTFPKLFLPEFQKRNSWIVTAYSNENEEKAEFYNAYFIYKHYHCSVCGTVEITKKRAKGKDNYCRGHTCKVCKNSDFLNLLSNNEFFKAKNINFELFENQDFYHIQPYIYIPFVNYENKVIDKKIELRGYKCDKKIYNPSYFKDDFFKEENIKYKYTDISINEINNFFLESLNDALSLKIEEIKDELPYK
ncbi:hypothetical protein CJ671_08960 [Aliarcobacter cryaerophilus]|jgi:hypothetical protein|uniref:Uncharacterized protein n=1 Tax=Aliarcobacter cryaerophilus TaxID=28198 RepID=A0A2S9SPH1_9BACT|nr:hypothetical protein [Aliarcobacter cryaerophilus]PRM88495.1 hypothetical protein CJ671_08960 [Aliarcobacter cryaerophilus]